VTEEKNFKATGALWYVIDAYIEARKHTKFQVSSFKTEGVAAI
jgi:hypothetical protein